MAFAITAVMILVIATARASPTVPLDDPVYDELDQRELAGELPLFRGGFAPLTQARVHELLPDAPAPRAGWWLRPVERAALRVVAVREDARSYSTVVRPRNVAGMLALSCEMQEGRPCGDGLGVDSELDSAAGYGEWIAGAMRVRARSGGDRYGSGLDLDRAYVNGELGPIAAELGRDVVVLGPAARTQLGWGTNAPPLDHLRLSGARPLAVWPSLWPSLRANAVYVVGRPAAPQSYPGNLVTLARAQLDIGDRVEVGAMQLLQLGGDGAPGLGFWDFVLEHVRRRDPSASASDSSNRRIGLDASVRIGVLGGGRVTYQLMFEDLRREITGALQHDADHAIELDTRWFTASWQRTGARASEHVPRVTGFTSAGRIVGDPLGPDAQSALVAGRIAAGRGVVMPWAQVVRLASDTYDFGEGPIVRTGSGETELRFRIGARTRWALGDRLELDADAAIEDVERAAFVPGARHVNAVLRVLLVWRPSATLMMGGTR